MCAWLWDFASAMPNEGGSKPHRALKDVFPNLKKDGNGAGASQEEAPKDDVERFEAAFSKVAEENQDTLGSVDSATLSSQLTWTSSSYDRKLHRNLLKALAKHTTKESAEALLKELNDPASYNRLSSEFENEASVTLNAKRQKQLVSAAKYILAAAKDRSTEDGLTTEEAEKLYEKFGPNELPEKETSFLVLILEHFFAPMPCMIWVAVLVEGVLENWLDMGVLLCLQFLNGGVGLYEATKAADAVAELKASLKPSAQVKRDGVWKNVDAKYLVPGDLVALSLGAAVPADCSIKEGTVDIDQAALTGESLPVTMNAGECPKMGSTVVRGEVEATVEATGADTFFGKTAMLINNASGGLSNVQKVLLNIMVVLMFLCIALCGTAFFYLIFKMKENVPDALSFAVVVLVASIPMAMELVTTSTMAIGSHTLAGMDAIVARLSAIEDMAGMNVLCSDKTGTLTLNKMVIQDECPTFVEGLDQRTVLFYAALAAKWWEPPKDALDTLVLNSADLSLCQPYRHVDYRPFDPTSKRTEAEIEKKDGSERFKVTKGAPNIIIELCEEKESIRDIVQTEVMAFAERGVRCLAVAKTEENGQYRFQGILTFLDPPRPDTKYTLDKAKDFGIAVKMITGDHTVIGKETMRQLGQGTNLLSADALPELDSSGEVTDDVKELYSQTIIEADGFGQVFPEHKYFIVDTLRSRGYRVGMTGDGVNDAPALKRADVGIAVQGSTDAARAAADIVLTKPGLSVLVEAIIIARSIFQRIKNYIIYRVACTIQLLLFFFVGLLLFHPNTYCPPGDKCMMSPGIYTDDGWPSYFKLPVIALVIITVLNDGATIAIAYDNVKPGHNPEVWNLLWLYVLSTALGLVALLSSLLLLHLGLSSHNPASLLHSLGIGKLAFRQIQAMIYLKVSISDFLTLFAARTKGPFFSVMPHWKLAAAGIFALTCSSLLSLSWPFAQTGKDGMSSIDPKILLFVWIYCLLFFFLQDLIKVVLNHFVIAKMQTRAEAVFMLRSESSSSNLGGIAGPGDGNNLQQPLLASSN